MSGHLHIRDIVARHEEQNSYNRHGSRKQYQQLATTNNQRVLLDHNTRLLHNQDTASTSYSNTPWFSDEGRTIVTLHNEILAFTTYVRPTPQEVDARKLVVQRLEQVVQGTWPEQNPRLEVFGSVAFDLVLPDGDIDVVIVLRSTPVPHMLKSMLYRLASKVRAAEIAASTQVIAHSKVPIVKITTTPEFGSFSVDISIAVDNNNGLLAIPRVKHYLQDMPALRPLILVVKNYLVLHDLNSAATSGLSSYSVICMCINFLQRNPTSLPSASITSPHKTQSLGRLLVAFLSYYADDFPYETAVISVATEGLSSKEEKGWILPSQKDLLSIECLVNQDKDVSKGSSRIKQVRDLFREGAELLKQQRSRGVSVLGRIVQVHENTYRRRHEIGKLVDSGRLRHLVSSNLPGTYRSRGLPHGRSHWDSDYDTSRRKSSQSVYDDRDQNYQNKRYSPYIRPGNRREDRGRQRRGTGRPPGYESGRSLAERITF